MNDSQIISLLQSEPREAVKEILSKYGDALLGIIIKIVGTKEVAEEVLQDSCIKIWKNAEKYDRAKGKLFTWCLNIARNTAIDRIRTQKFQRNKTSKSLKEDVSNNVTFSEEMQVKDVGLHQQINKLEEKYRVIIDLLYLKGYTQQEATDELNIPLGTVKSRARIAIRELRKLLSVLLLLLTIVISLLLTK
ncbi:MAG: RNA polymerase sigma factor [Bacteroidota bacterium]